jgi:hypothetical protein
LVGRFVDGGVDTFCPELFAVGARDLTVALYLFLPAIDAGCGDTDAFAGLFGREFVIWFGRG